jgi:hypothetical protein
MTWLIAYCAKAFIIVPLFVFIVWPLERAISRLLPEGRVKRLLFYSWEA